MDIKGLIYKLQNIYEYSISNGLSNDVSNELKIMLSEVRRQMQVREFLFENKTLNKLIDLEEIGMLFHKYENSGHTKERIELLKRIIITSRNIFTLAGFKLPKGY
ncbi:MAG: hypothetical protein AB1571_02535 [Nanoarchaeota archaeon]